MLTIGITGYLITSVFQGSAQQLLTLLTWFFAELIPASLALFIWVLFEEEKPVPKWMIAGIALNGALVLWLEHQFVTGGYFTIAVQLSYLVKAMWLATCLAVLWAGRQLDLVETRQALRLIFIRLIVLIVMVVGIIEVASGLQVPRWVEVPGMLAIFLAALGVNLAFIKTNPQIALVASPQVVRTESEDALIIKLLARMRDDRLYADHDIRVTTLAATLGVPDYQLRKRINQGLGYRNFNHFINNYRIAEAAERLLTQHRTPVLSIALDVGFRSISSFNSAFQLQYRLTPTQYRRKHLSDSRNID